MKKILLTTSLAIAAGLFIPQLARADHYDHDDYRDAKKTLSQLQDSYAHLAELRERNGASPHIRRELTDVSVGLSRIRVEIDQRRANPDRVEADCRHVDEMIAHIEQEYHFHRTHAAMIFHYRD
jgi:hypothetical protein